MENHLELKKSEISEMFFHLETHMGEEEVGKATLRRDRCKLGLVGWIHLQLKSFRN